MLFYEHRVNQYIDVSIVLYQNDKLYATACLKDPLTHAKVLIADMNFPIGTSYEEAVVLMCEEMRNIFNQCIDSFTITK